jgi:hypothetical protein
MRSVDVREEPSSVGRCRAAYISIDEVDCQILELLCIEDVNAFNLDIAFADRRCPDIALIPVT